MKSLAKTLFTLYILALVWLILFKFSFDISSVLLNYQSRSLNLIPFADLHSGRELISNLVVFIPFGLLLSINLNRMGIWWRLVLISIFSLVVEIIQFALAIGTTDITDVVANASGGLAGLLLYDVGKKYMNNKNLDRLIIAAGFVVLVIFILLRLFVFKVRY